MSEDQTHLGALRPIQLFINDGQAVTTSRDVAAYFGGRHSRLLRSIDRLPCSPEFRRVNFEPVDFVDAKNKSRRMVQMTRAGFNLLTMSLTGPRATLDKEAYITAFSAMEARARGALTLEQRFAASLTALQLELDLVKSALIRSRKETTRVTPEVVSRAKALFAQGMSAGGVAKNLHIGRTTAHNIRHGELSRRAQGAPA